MDDENNQLIASSDSNPQQSERRLYKRRWIILLIVSLINVCNAGIWISLAPVADRAAAYYGVNQNEIDLFSTVFFISTIIVGFIAMWILDRNGLLLGIYFGAILTALGISVRALSSTSYVINWLSLSLRTQFFIAIAGQIIAGCAQPFVLFTPTKVAELWFPTNQRALATTVTGMSNPLGIVLGNIISPLIVTNSEKIPFLSIVWIIPSLATLLLTAVFVRSSKPPTPPSDSAEIVSTIPYFIGLKQLLTQKPYLLLVLYMGSSIGMFSALVTVMEQILNANGYEDSFSSDCIAVMIVSGVFGSAFVSYIVGRNGKYIEAMKLSVGLTAISINGLLVSFNYPSIKAIIMTFSAVFGFFGFMTYPLGLELGIECSFPIVPEATTSGLIMLSGQLQGILFIYLTTASVTQTEAGVYVYEYSMIILLSILVFISCVFIVFFFTEYKRLKCETLTARVDQSPINSLSFNSNSFFS